MSSVPPPPARRTSAGSRAPWPIVSTSAKIDRDPAPFPSAIIAWGRQALSARGVQARRKALRIRHINGSAYEEAQGGQEEAQGVQESPLNPLSVSPRGERALVYVALRGAQHLSWGVGACHCWPL
jgi:hypothetical protein